MAYTLLVAGVIWFGLRGKEPSLKSYLVIGTAAAAATLWMMR